MISLHVYGRSSNIDGSVSCTCRALPNRGLGRRVPGALGLGKGEKARRVFSRRRRDRASPPAAGEVQRLQVRQPRDVGERAVSRMQAPRFSLCSCVCVCVCVCERECVTPPPHEIDSLSMCREIPL
jgi:hypothetical protein